jgi:hypothetical protein
MRRFRESTLWVFKAFKLNCSPKAGVPPVTVATSGAARETRRPENLII